MYRYPFKSRRDRMLQISLGKHLVRLEYFQNSLENKQTFFQASSQFIRNETIDYLQCDMRITLGIVSSALYFPEEYFVSIITCSSGKTFSFPRNLRHTLDELYWLNTILISPREEDILKRKGTGRIQCQRIKVFFRERGVNL